MSQSTTYIDTLRVLDQLKLKGLSVTMYDGEYSLIMPENPPSGVLSVLGIRNVIPSTAFQLEWVQPTEAGYVDTINCDVLNALQEINSGAIFRTEYLESTDLNIRKVNGTERCAFEVSPDQTESLILYKLPPTRSITEKQILTQVNGEMTWEDVPDALPVPSGQLCYYYEIVRNSNLPSNGSIGGLPLQIDMFPEAIFSGDMIFEIILSWYGYKEDGGVQYLTLYMSSGPYPTGGRFLTPSVRDYHYHSDSSKNITNQLISWFKPDSGVTFFTISPSLLNWSSNNLFVEKISLMVKPIGRQLT